MAYKPDIEGEVLVFKLASARRKAMRSATVEAMSLLSHLGAIELFNGPFGAQTGIFYIEISSEGLKKAESLISRLAYTALVEKVEFAAPEDHRISGTLPRWKGRPYSLVRIYEAEQSLLRDLAPDRREFILPTHEGNLRRVVGYRGGGGKSNRRGLPVIDARLLVNLAYTQTGRRFLDPFAGAGGIIIEAVRSEYETFSVDVDPFVMYGLHNLASHVVADSRHLPFQSACFDCIASEPPFDEDASEVICQAVLEIDRVLCAGGSVALMVADHQVDQLLRAVTPLSWQIRLHEHIDRKGLPVTVLSWRKP